MNPIHANTSKSEAEPLEPLQIAANHRRSRRSRRGEGKLDSRSPSVEEDPSLKRLRSFASVARTHARTESDFRCGGRLKAVALAESSHPEGGVQTDSNTETRLHPIFRNPENCASLPRKTLIFVDWQFVDEVLDGILDGANFLTEESFGKSFG